MVTTTCGRMSGFMFDHDYVKWVFPDDPRDCFSFDLDARVEPRPFVGLREETIRSARKIADSTDAPITLLLSGGIDSEAMLVAFKQSGVDFDCTVIDLAYGLNWYDVRLAEKLAHHHGVRLNHIKVNPFQVWGESPEWIDKYRSDSAMTRVFLYAMNLVEKFPVIARKIPIRVDLSRSPVDGMDSAFPDPVYMGMKPSYLILDEMWKDRGKSGVSMFHMYSPYQLREWLIHPIFRAWCKQIRGSGVFSFDQIKHLIYQQEFPEIILSRPSLSGEDNFKNHVLDQWFNKWVRYHRLNTMIKMTLSEVGNRLERMGLGNFSKISAVQPQMLQPGKLIIESLIRIRKSPYIPWFPGESDRTALPEQPGGIIDRLFQESENGLSYTRTTVFESPEVRDFYNARPEVIAFEETLRQYDIQNDIKSRRVEDIPTLYGVT